MRGLMLALWLITVSANAQILSAVIVAYKYLSAEQVPVHYVKVESHAADFESAKQQAFKQAIEHTVGVLVLAQTQSSSQRIVRNDVFNYSAGFVDKYKILSRIDLPNSVKLNMEVWVSHSAIADSLLNSDSVREQINGSRIGVQAQTLIDQRKSADSMLQSVMSNYPHKAHDIEIEPVKVTLNSQRQVEVTVPFTIKWNKKFIDSLEEALDRINQYPQCSNFMSNCGNVPYIALNTGGLFQSTNGAWFKDDTATKIMFDNMVTDMPAVKVELQGHSRAVYCFVADNLINHQTRQLAQIAGRTSMIFTKKTLKTAVTFKPALQSVADYSTVSVNLVRKSQCEL